METKFPKDAEVVYYKSVSQDDVPGGYSFETDDNFIEGADGVHPNVFAAMEKTYLGQTAVIVLRKCEDEPDEENNFLIKFKDGTTAWVMDVEIVRI